MYLSLFIFFRLLFLSYREEGIIFLSVPRRSSEDAVYNEKKKEER